MASNDPVALCHPPPYGRHATPSKRDGRALEVNTDDYGAFAQGQRRDVGSAGPVTPIAIGPVRSFPPSPTPSRALHRHLLNCGGDGATRRRHTGCCAPCGLPSAAPSSQCTDDDHTGDPYTATLEATPGRIQGTP
jgi:hypothetical protein